MNHQLTRSEKLTYIPILMVQYIGSTSQRVAKVVVVLARDFIVFLLHSAKENFKNLVDKIKLVANEIFDPNYKNRETSLARIHRLLLEGGT